MKTLKMLYVLFCWAMSGVLVFAGVFAGVSSSEYDKACFYLLLSGYFFFHGKLHDEPEIR